VRRRPRPAVLLVGIVGVGLAGRFIVTHTQSESGSVLELASEKRPADFDQSVSARKISQKPNHSITNMVLSKYFEDLGKIARAPLLRFEF